MVAEGYKEYYDSLGIWTNMDVEKYKCLRCNAKFYDVIGDYIYCPYCGKKLVEREENE